ncbi:MAG: hypothetical protein HY769_04635 [Candidatus Stahlbacteria bacterium]|nr:hypothetical protein [Candidatus Stahlbacteria bacterium]
MKEVFLKWVGAGIVLSITGCAIRIGNFPVPKSIIREKVEVVGKEIIGSEPVTEKTEIQLLNTPNTENPYFIISAHKRVKEKDFYKMTLRYTYSIKPLGWAILLPSAALLSGTGIYAADKGYVVLGCDLIGITILGGVYISSLIQPVIKFQPASEIRPEELRPLSGNMSINVNGKSQKVEIDADGVVKIATNKLFKEIPRKGQQLVLTATCDESKSQRFILSSAQIDGIRQVMLEEKREKQQREAEKQRRLAKYREVNPDYLAFGLSNYSGEYVAFEGIISTQPKNYGIFDLWFSVGNVFCRISIVNLERIDFDPFFREIKVYGRVVPVAVRFLFFEPRLTYVVEIHEMYPAK